MIEKWTGELVGKMHNERVRMEDIASMVGWTKQYVCMILNGHRNPPGAREKLETAYARIIENRNHRPEDEAV